MNCFKTAFILFSGLFLLTGCSAVGTSIHGPKASSSTPSLHRTGPPPHAPAHGYRHKHHDGHEMVYDSGLGVYLVVNIPETYFGNNVYIRMTADGRWLVSATLGGVWRVAVGNEVPYSLKEHKKQENSSNKKGHKKNKPKNN